jgi:hypothetical protein
MLHSIWTLLPLALVEPGLGTALDELIGRRIPHANSFEAPAHGLFTA